jgi:RND superfamily putative drug exporter
VARILSLPAGRRAKWGVAAAWAVLVALMLVADVPSRYADAETDESTSYLPADAESTRELLAAERVEGGEELPAVIVYHRDGGLTPQDRALIEADREALNTAPGDVDATFRGTSVVGEPRSSPRGDAALLVVDLEGNSESEALLAGVAELRRRVSRPGPGLTVRVTGPAGVAADANEVFEEINRTLLLAAAGLVLLLLVAIYRSPLMMWIPLLAVGVAELATRAAGFGLAELGTTINSQTSAIVSVLVLGVGTDYALVVIARYREELRRHADRHDALAVALRSTGPAVLGAALAVAAALACLSLAEVEGTAGLGPVAAMSVAVTAVAMVTLLPALLGIAGRAAFWRPPVLGWGDGVPRAGDQRSDLTHVFWTRLGERVDRRPRRVWATTAAVLSVAALGLVRMDAGLAQSENLRGDAESIEGQALIAGSFPPGETAPTDVFVPDPDRVSAVITAAEAAPGVASAEPGIVGSVETLVAVVLDKDPFSDAAIDATPAIREAVKAAGGPGALVGGPTAVEHDLRAAAARDRAVIVPISVLVVTSVLVALLRALVLPLLLMATVLLSYAATLGVSVFVFDVVFGFPGLDPSLPLYVFVFLIGLGTDYNLFLMRRVREEVADRGHHAGVMRGLAATGGVITSAGVILAGTFAVLAVLPLVTLTQMGFAIGFGLLLDALVVRSVLVPALALDVGPRVWWPSALARGR